MEHQDGSNDTRKGSSLTGVIWWAYLITAVLAIPSLSFLVTTVLPVSGAVELLIFIVACWMCTYFGMRLMSPPKQKDDPK